MRNYKMNPKITMPEIFKNPRYRGKHIILAAGKIYTAKTGDGAVEILKKLEKNILTLSRKLLTFQKPDH